MAWIEQRGNQFHLGIRLGARKLKRTLQTNDPKEAQELADRVDRRLRLIDQGDLVIPPDADPMTFLLSDGKLTQPVVINAGVSLAELCQRYTDEMPAGSLEPNTLYTLKIHLSHLRRILGDRFHVDRLKFADLQRYIDSRSRESGRRGKTISTVTIKKELTSFSGTWTWAIRMGLVKASFPNKGLRYPKTHDKPPFQTWTEIERQIELSEITEDEQAELWEGLYLTAQEIEQVLDFVEKNARHPAIYPMLVLAAHTGARRSEILRSEFADFDLTANIVHLRELKRARGKSTMRSVPLSGRLLRVMRNCVDGATCRSTFGARNGPENPLSLLELLSHLSTFVAHAASLPSGSRDDGPSSKFTNPN